MSAGADAEASFGGLAQPAASATSTVPAAARAIEDNVVGAFNEGMALAWVLLEVLAALAIAIGIVWWTFPKKPRPPAQGRDDEPR